VSNISLATTILTLGSWLLHNDYFVDLANISSSVVSLGRNCWVLSLIVFV